MSDETSGCSGEYGLVMPFLPVASKGGPYNDSDYAAGYEMGLLDVHLADPLALAWLHRTLRVENREQADLLAMRHGWRATFFEHDDEWVGAEFIRLDPASRDHSG